MCDKPIVSVVFVVILRGHYTIAAPPQTEKQSLTRRQTFRKTLGVDD